MEQQDDFVIVGIEDARPVDIVEPELLPLEPKKVQQIQDWLHPTDYRSEGSEYNKHLNAHLDGTGNWIEDTEEYRQWHGAEHRGSLWIKAMPGAGKSVLAASVAAKLGAKEQVPVLHFFFRQIIATNQRPIHLLQDWLSQLLHQSPLLQNNLHAYVSNSRAIETISFDDLWKTLIGALCMLPKVYCVADALDEMDMGNERFLQQLLDLGRHKTSSIKVLMTSRLVPRIEKVLKHSTVVHLSLFESAVNADIMHYVRTRLAEVTLPEATRSVIEGAMNTKARGLFLYARLMLDDILQSPDDRAIDADAVREKVEHLPSNVNDMYNEMLADHSRRSGTSQEMQITLLQWVTQSFRPLRLLELASLIEFIHPSLNTGRDTKAIVRAGCGPLLEILEDETVSIIHHSFTEFLRDETRHSSNPKSLPFPIIENNKEAQRQRLLTCLRYLMSDALKDWNVESDRNAWYSQPNPGFKLKHPFCDYAANYWDDHYRRAATGDTTPALDEFLHPNSENRRAWLDMVWGRGQLDEITPVDIAAPCRLKDYTAPLLARNVYEIEAVDDKGNSPLAWAACMGHVDIVSMLLEHGAQPDLTNSKNGRKPLHSAAAANHSAVIQRLLESGVDPITRSSYGDTQKTRRASAPAVLNVAQSGHLETMLVLIPYLQPSILNEALCWAASRGQTDVMAALLQTPGVDVNCRSEDGATPLLEAASTQNPRAIELLLAKGAIATVRVHDPNRSASPFEAETALHKFCQRSYQKNDETSTRKAFAVLYKVGCDVNAVDGTGSTPLHRAAGNGDCLLMNMLLDHGANIDATDGDGATPLHRTAHACMSYSKPAVELLCKRGASVNLQTKSKGYTPLHYYANHRQKSEQSTCMRIMVGYGVFPNLRDREGNTALHSVIDNDKWGYFSRESMDCYLKAGFDTMARNNKLETPLHLAKSWNKATRDLTDTLVDREAKDIEGRSILFRLVDKEGQCSNEREVSERLVESGFDIYTRDLKGRTLLHIVARRPHSFSFKDQLEFWVKVGLDPFAKDLDGNTILHQAAGSSYCSSLSDWREHFESIFKLLGSDVHSWNNSGQTALHFAASWKGETSSILTAPGARMQALIDVGRELSCPLDVNKRESEQKTPLHMAAATSSRLVKILLDAGAEPAPVDAYGHTPLHVACRAGESNSVGLLLQHYKAHGHQMAIDQEDFCGRSPLFGACISGRVESVRLLIEAGADVNRKDYYQVMPLEVCFDLRSDASVMKLSPQRRRSSSVDGTDWQSDMWAASEKDTPNVRAVVRTLIASGAKIDGKTEKRWSGPYLDEKLPRPLSAAIYAGNEVVADELIKSVSRESGSEVDDFTTQPWNDDFDSFELDYLRQRSEGTVLALTKHVVKNVSNLPLFKELLLLDNEKAIEEFSHLGADLTKPEISPHHGKHVGVSCLHVLAGRGRVDLMKRFMDQITIMDDAWLQAQFDDMHENEDEISLPIHAACRRELPNFAMLELLSQRHVNTKNYCRKKAKKLEPASTSLHLLAAGSHWWQPHAVEILLKNGADIEAKDSEGQTPLQVASKLAAEYLLEHGADPNVLDAQGRTRLSTCGCDPEMVRLLLTYGADIRAGEVPAILNAVQSRNMESLNLFLSHGVDLNVRKVATASELATRYGRDVQNQEMFPLHAAAILGHYPEKNRLMHIEIINLLLKHGADPYATYENNTTIVHHVVTGEGILEPFIEMHGFDLERRNGSGQTLLLASCETPSTLVPRGGGWGAHEARGPTVTEYLISKGANIEVVDNDGKNALQCLVRCRNHSTSKVPVLKYLLAQLVGTKLLKQKDNEGYTPLQGALKHRCLWPIETLLEQGADPLEPDPEGNTALHHLARWLPDRHIIAEAKLFKQFLSLGADINATNAAGETPLFLFFGTEATSSSITDSHVRHIPLFVGAGADFLARNPKGQTLLYVTADQRSADGGMALSRGYVCDTLVNTFKALVELGVDPTAEDEEGRSALDVAAAHGQTRLLELFKRKN